MGVHDGLLVHSHLPPVMEDSFLTPISQRLLFPQILILGLILSSSCAITSFADGVSSSDSNALLKFRDSLLSTADANNIAQLRQVFSSWNSNSNSTTPCSGNYANWVGVLCSDGNVWGLQLENMTLSGEIDVDSLLQLPNLRTLSFMNNTLDGPFPEFKKLGLPLRSLYLSNNQFSGQIPNDAFGDMSNLKKLYLAYNQFSGTIPTSIGQLPKLIDLSLQGNRFVGSIPIFNQNYNLKSVNVSYNQLEGPIPATLAHFSPASFSGNKDLCGKPLNTSCKYPVVDHSTPPDGLNDSLDEIGYHGEYSMLKAILVVACIGVALGVIILVAVIICTRRRNQTPRLGNAGSSQYNNKSNNIYNGCMAVASSRQLNVMKKKSENGDVYHEHHSLSATDYVNNTSRSTITTSNSAPGGGQKSMSTSQQQQHGKLSFIRDDRHKFDLQDLLRASAEVLGSGNFGSSYKAVLMDGNSVVVKRFKQMNSVDRQEFNEHMMRLGRLLHPNLLPLVAYYYRKEEKLLVSDYVRNGSLASHLHGNHKADQPGLDWPTRLKIVKGVAKGLLYLYKELPTLVVPHGHLKSSNVLLDDSFNPLLMDYTLVPVMNQEHARRIMVVYRSPEYIQHGQLTKKTDVWSLGILILELLTGKFPPPNYQLPTAKGASPGRGGGGAGDLVSWVDSIVKEAEALQVFDKELLVVANGNTTNCEGEMLKLFQIGMACCEEDVSKRLDLEEAVSKIQDLNEKDRTENIITVNNSNYHNYDLSLL